RWRGRCRRRTRRCIAASALAATGWNAARPGRCRARRRERPGHSPPASGLPSSKARAAAARLSLGPQPQVDALVVEVVGVVRGRVVGRLGLFGHHLDDLQGAVLALHVRQGDVDRVALAARAVVVAAEVVDQDGVVVVVVVLAAVGFTGGAAAAGGNDAGGILEAVVAVVVEGDAVVAGMADVFHP